MTRTRGWHQPLALNTQTRIKFSGTGVRPQRRNGLTLIELLVCMALLCCLLTLALPGYSRLVQRAARNEARTALIRAALWLERVHSIEGQYPQAGALAPSLRLSDSGRYQLSYEPGNPPVTYRLVASPVAGSGQADDICGAFVLTHAGVRSVISLSPAATDAHCWPR
jgi:type IV pilus assembly protein PilE